MVTENKCAHDISKQLQRPGEGNRWCLSPRLEHRWEIEVHSVCVQLIGVNVVSRLICHWNERVDLSLETCGLCF